MTSGYTRFSAKILHVKHKSGINIDKHEIRKSSGRTEVYSYTINSKKKGFALIDDKLYELKNQQLQPVPDIKFSINEDSEVTINKEEGNFVLSTK